MLEEASLLREYADSRNEAAFAKVVGRHFDGVYSAALRRVGGDEHLAKDITQEVFVTLARSAAKVSLHPVLSAWLYVTTRNIAALKIRGDRRRRIREEEAAAMHDNSSQDDSGTAWDQVGPMLDRLMDDLGETDRRAILLRFIERRSFVEVGDALGLSENAARMRVDRALDKLRGMLRKLGIVSTTTALAAVLTEQAVIAAPAGLAAEATAAAIAGSIRGGASGYLASCISIMMNTNKLAIGVTAVLSLASGIGIAVSRDSLRMASLTRENQRLERQLNGALSREAVLKSRALSNPTQSRMADLEAKVREEMLSSASTPSPAASSYRNAGQATPLDALETFMWASDRCDTTMLAKTIVFGGNGRQKAEAVLAALPEEARSQFASPEDLYALFIADDALTSPPPPEDIVQSVSVQLDGTDRAVLVFPGPNHQQVYQNTTDGWKLVFPEIAVEQWANKFLSVQQTQSPPEKGN
jgi:RNA polymerase sigma factor (sigma-70 family)